MTVEINKVEERYRISLDLTRDELIDLNSQISNILKAEADEAEQEEEVVVWNPRSKRHETIKKKDLLPSEIYLRTHLP